MTTPTPADMTIEEILDAFKRYILVQADIDSKKVMGGTVKFKGGLHLPKQQALAAIQALVGEIIGSDEPDEVVSDWSGDPPSRIVRSNPRNQLRAEQRKRLSALIRGEGEGLTERGNGALREIE